MKMTNRDKMLVKQFKEDVINNYKGESHIEYFYSSKMFGFKEYFRNEEDRVVFFGRDMLITKPTMFANALKRQIPTIKYVDFSYDDKGNAINVLIELEKE